MRITEIKTVKIDHDCKDVPIYLTWINKLGGYSYWLFERFNTETTRTRNVYQYENNILDLENAIGTNEVTSKDISPQLEVGAKIHISDMDGIRGLFESPKVLMLANPDTWTVDGAKWKRVIVNTGSLVVNETDKRYYDVSFKLDLPMVFNQKE